MRMMITLILSIAALIAGPASADQTVSGSLNGTFIGATTDNSASFSGNIEGDWSATISTDSAGASSITASGTGSFGATGLSGTWQITGYDPATRRISVVWSAPGNRGPLSAAGSADGNVSLLLDPATLKATGAFTGQFFTADGIKTVNGTWTVTLQTPAVATVKGSVQGTFLGTASFVGNMSGSATGTWTARALPDGSISGSASGSYDGGNVAVPVYGTVCICGTWTGTLSRNSQGVYSFEGSWTHPSVSGTAAGLGGGPISWVIDTGTTPFHANGSFSGSTSFTFLSFSVPIAASGTWTASLPITP